MVEEMAETLKIADLTKLRPATHEDIDSIAPMLDGVQELLGTTYALVPKDGEKRRECLKSLIDRYVFIVAEKSGEITGFVCMLLTKHVLNPDILAAYEGLYWVEPKHRGTKVGVVLMDVAVKVCKERGCQWIWWASPKDGIAPANALARRGFKEQERQWLLEVEQ